MVRHIVVSTLLVILLICAGCSSSGPPIDMGESHYKMAQASMATKDYTTALQHMLVAVKLKPGNTDYHSTLAVIYLNKKAYPEAEKEFKRALQLRPGDPTIQHNLAALYYDMQRWDDAAVLFRLAADNLLFHHPIRALNGLGAAYTKGGHEMKAVMAYKEALARDRNNLLALYRLGQLYYTMHKYELAAKRFNDMLVIVPDNTDVHMSLGKTYMQMEKNELAAKEFREVANREDQNERGRQAREYLQLLDIK